MICFLLVFILFHVKTRHFQMITCMCEMTKQKHQSDLDAIKTQHRADIKTLTAQHHRDKNQWEKRLASVKDDVTVSLRKAHEKQLRIWGRHEQSQSQPKKWREAPGPSSGRNATKKRFKGWVFLFGYFTLMQFHLQEQAVLNLSGSQFWTYKISGDRL